MMRIWLLAMLVSLWVPAAAAQTRLVLGYTATQANASAYVAKEQGFFIEHGLDVEMSFVTVGSTIPAALLSGSLDVAGPTPSIFIQAVDGEIDLVALAGGGVRIGKTDAGVVVRAGSGIAAPRDFEGRKVGVPGLNGLLHVLFRQWLANHGADHRKVNFVELTFPTMGTVLKSGGVDAVVSAGPIMLGIVASGVGTFVADYLQGVPDGMSVGLWASTREWARHNPATVKAFRDALAEAVAFIEKNPEAARAAMGKYIKVPPPILAKMIITPQDATMREAQLQWWVDVMRQQELIRRRPDVARLIVP